MSDVCSKCGFDSDAMIAGMEAVNRELHRKDAEIVTLKNCLFQMQNAAKDLAADLQRHKSCLEVARGALSDDVEALNHYKLLLSPFDKPPRTPESNAHDLRIVEKLIANHEATLHQINEVLGGDSTKTTEK